MIERKKERDRFTLRDLMVLYQKLIMKGGVVRHTSNCGGAGWRGVLGCSSHIGNRGLFHMQLPYNCTWFKTSLHKALLSHGTRSFPGTAKNVACWRNLALGKGGCMTTTANLVPTKKELMTGTLYPGLLLRRRYARTHPPQECQSPNAKSSYVCSCVYVLRV